MTQQSYFSILALALAWSATHVCSFCFIFFLIYAHYPAKLRGGRPSRTVTLICSAELRDTDLSRAPLVLHTHSQFSRFKELWAASSSISMHKWFSIYTLCPQLFLIPHIILTFLCCIGFQRDPRTCSNIFHVSDFLIFPFDLVVKSWLFLNSLKSVFFIPYFDFLTDRRRGAWEIQLLEEMNRCNWRFEWVAMEKALFMSLS